MSAKWMRIESNFVNHFKVQRLATQLELPKAQAGWMIMCALSWFSQFCPTGQVPGQHRDSDARALEVFCEWDGEAGKMVAAFIAVGLIDTAEDGGFGYHDWEAHQGKVAASAEKERKRKADYRARKATEKPAPSPYLSRGTSRGTNTGRPALRDVTGRDGTGRSSSYDDDGTSPPTPGLLVFERFQQARATHGWAREESPSRDELDGFLAEVAASLRDTVDGARVALEVAAKGYAKDRFWLAKSLPWAGFVEQWARHVSAPALRDAAAEADEVLA